MARSTIQRRHDAEREQLQHYAEMLRRAVRAPRPKPNFAAALDEAQRGFTAQAVRAPDAWRPQMKTRDPARLRLAAARHLFARFAVPAMLEDIWFDTTGLAADEVQLRKRWYVVAAGGGSLYKEVASRWLTRKEVHTFLNPPPGLDFNQAFWHAIARPCVAEASHALGIARSKIARTPRSEIAFWRKVVRFFGANPAPVETIDDLCDYLADCRRRDPAYSVEGRTLASLARRMHEWHRDIAAIERIEAFRQRVASRAGQAAQAGRAGRARLGSAGAAADRVVWAGSPLADWEWTPSAKDATVKGERFVIRQLRQAEDLVMESRAMRHCVSSYAAKCIAGHASIWSLRRCTKTGIDRLLTIEVDEQRRAIQVRGFANRLAQPHERKVLERWAQARGVALR
jgi:hypothetical protein